MSSGVKTESMSDILNSAIERHYDNSPTFNLDNVFPGINLEVKPSEGHITLIPAGSKVG